MSETPRKTLRLPVRQSGEEVLVNPRRKPIRGASASVRKKEEQPEAEKPESAAKRDWRKKTSGAQKHAPSNRARTEPGKETPSRETARPARTPSSPARKPDFRKRDDRMPDGKSGDRQGKDIARARDFREERARTEDRGAPIADSPTRTNEQSGVRVSKLLAELGMCSRREADEYIVRGWVYVDGERITELGTRADPSARITLDQQAKATQQRQMTVLLHKPVGYVSGQPEPGFQPALALIRPENQDRTSDTPIFHASHLKGMAPAGRLDIDSTGLLVLTQDGRVARQLIGENSKIEKEYLVRVEGQLSEKGLALLNHGLELDEKALKPAKVEWLNSDQLRFILHEGRKRQIRRMCELVGLKVTGLKRVRIGKVRLGDLPPGKWRYLRDNEAF